MKNLLERYKTYKVDIEGKSVNSINQYIYRLQSFLEYYNITTEQQFLAITVDKVKAWISYLVEQNNDVTTRNAKLVAIREIYKFLYEQEDRQIDMKILKLKSAKVPQRESKYLNEVESENFLYNISNPRIYAMVIMFLSTGMRFSELQQITLEDYNKGFVSVIGKGNKERTLYFSPRCLKAIDNYIKTKRNHTIERLNIKNNMLFISDEGTPVTRQSFTTSLKMYAKKAGIEWWKSMSPHKLRHTFATQVLNERDEHGGLKHTIKDVQEVLGHTNIVTTNRYVHSNEETRKNITSKWGEN